MQALSFSLIRTMVQSGKYVLDVNPILFNHPVLVHKGIETIDSDVKNEAFHGKFLSLCQTSTSRETLVELESLFSIVVSVVIPPSRPYVNTQNLTWGKRFVVSMKNWLRKTRWLVLKPLESVTLPLSILVGEGTEIPKCAIVIDPELAAQGLTASIVTPALRHETTGTLSAYTYVTLNNHFPNRSIVIEDLMRIGELRILK